MVNYNLGVVSASLNPDQIIAIQSAVEMGFGFIQIGAMSDSGCLEISLNECLARNAGYITPFSISVSKDANLDIWHRRLERAAFFAILSNKVGYLSGHIPRLESNPQEYNPAALVKLQDLLFRCFALTFLAETDIDPRKLKVLVDSYRTQVIGTQPNTSRLRVVFDGANLLINRAATDYEGIEAAIETFQTGDIAVAHLKSAGTDGKEVPFGYGVIGGANARRYVDSLAAKGCEYFLIEATGPMETRLERAGRAHEFVRKYLSDLFYANCDSGPRKLLLQQASSC